VRVASRSRRVLFGAALLCALLAQAVAPLSGTAEGFWAPPWGEPPAAESPSQPIAADCIDPLAGQPEPAPGLGLPSLSPPIDCTESEPTPLPLPAPMAPPVTSGALADPSSQAAAAEACTPPAEGVPCETPSVDPGVVPSVEPAVTPFIECVETAPAGGSCDTGTPIDDAVTALQAIVATALTCVPEGTATPACVDAAFPPGEPCGSEPEDAAGCAADLLDCAGDEPAACVRPFVDGMAAIAANALGCATDSVCRDERIAAAHDAACADGVTPCAAVESCPDGEECALRPYTDCTADIDDSQCVAAEEWEAAAGAVCDPETVTPHVSACTPDAEVVEATACDVVETSEAECPTGIEPLPALRACAAGNDPAVCAAEAVEESGRGLACEQGLGVPCAAVESCPDGEECALRPYTDCTAAIDGSQCVVAEEWAAAAGAVCDPETVTPHVSACRPDGEVAHGSLYALVDGAFCGQDDEPPCAPPVVTDAHACATWTNGSLGLDGNCVVDAVVAGACAALTDEGDPCVLRDEPMASLLNCADVRADATGACRDTRDSCATGDVDECAGGVRQVTLKALCDAEAGCFPDLEEDLDGCATTAAGCVGAALLAQACRQTACPSELLDLAPCLTTRTDCNSQRFLEWWVGRACQSRTNNAACPKANPYVTQTGATITTGDTVTPVPFANGSPAYPYKSIQTALDQINAKWFVSPARVAPGSYGESLTHAASGPELRAERDGSGVVTLTGSGSSPALTLSGTRRVSLGGITVTSSSSAKPIDGPVVTATVVAPSGRRLVGEAVRYRVTDAVDEVAAPEPLRRQLVLSSPFRLDPDNMRISAVVDGVAVTPKITRVGDDVVVEFGEAAEIPEPPATEAWITPVGWSGSAVITVVPRSGMRLRGAVRVVGRETGVLYDEAVSANEVRVVHPTSGELPDGQPEPGVVIGGPTPAPSASAAPGPLPGPTGRLSGEDRAATAAAVSSSSFGTGVERVYIASGSGYADALAAGPAAGRAKAPVLLVERDRLPESTRAELERLSPQRLFVLGGDAVVGTEVEQWLRSLAPRLDRISGGDRYGTAAAIAAGHFAAGVPVVYIASGEGFADALGAGPAAAAQGGPVLLVRRDAIPEATVAQLRRLAPARIVVLGGTKAVSDVVATQLRLFTTGEVRRLRGPDRYGTAAAVTAYAFTRRVDTVYVATGAGFADALAGAPAAAQQGSPLLLVEGDRLPASAATELDRLRPRRIVILGGERSVSLRLERELRSYETARA
jgi:putative cell wall-binding protein